MIKFVSDLRQVGGCSLDPPVSSTNKTDRHDITEILLKVALNTIKPTNQPCCYSKIIWSCTQYVNMGPSWLWSYGSWIYKIRARCTTLCDKVCQWLATGRWFSPCPSVSSTNKTDRHDITKILLKVALNSINQTNNYICNQCLSPLMLRVRISIRARYTWYNIMW